MAARVETGIDPEWLARASAEDPVRHAYAVWDRLRFPDRVEFRTLYEDGVPSAYLLIWKGSPNLPVVHWIGTPREPRALLEALPPRPFIAVVPPAVARDVAELRGPARMSSVLWMAYELGSPVPEIPSRRARRLGAADRATLVAFAEKHPDVLTAPYLKADPGLEPTFGAFDWGRLGAVARATVALPAVWVIGGIFTTPGLRGRHLGSDVTAVAVRAALDAGARPSLYVREQNVPARRIYERLGFRLFEDRAWLDAFDAAV